MSKIKYKVDYHTGEMIPTQPKSMYCLVHEDMYDFMDVLKETELRLCWKLSKIMDFDNNVVMVKDVRIELGEVLGVSENRIAHCLKNLAEKGLLKRRGCGMYMVNPLYFSKCNAFKKHDLMKLFSSL